MLFDLNRALVANKFLEYLTSSECMNVNAYGYHPSLKAFATNLSRKSGLSVSYTADGLDPDNVKFQVTANSVDDYIMFKLTWL
jgi:hypothetical protein